MLGALAFYEFCANLAKIVDNEQARRKPKENVAIVDSSALFLYKFVNTKSWFWEKHILICWLFSTFSVGGNFRRPILY